MNLRRWNYSARSNPLHHPLHHPLHNYWMDGAAWVSQCPILPYQNFTYVWRAEQTGTYWYHSHNAIQRVDGLFGGIVIYDENELNELVNEIPLILTDWFNVDSIELQATNPYNYGGTKTMFGTTTHHCLDENRAFLHGVKVWVAIEWGL